MITYNQIETIIGTLKRWVDAQEKRNELEQERLRMERDRFSLEVERYGMEKMRADREDEAIARTLKNLNPGDFT